eukprot:304529-Pleurochrysis_carterae.AAC.1
MRVKREEVVDVTPQYMSLFDPGDCFRHCESAGIRLALCEPELQEPWEERALPSATGLCRAINGLFGTANARASVGAKRGVSGWCVTVHDFVWLEVTL